MVRRHRGIALLDVIVGSTMLAVGLTVVISMSSRSLIRQAHAERQITASWLADEILSMVLVVGPDEYVKTYPVRGNFDSPFDVFSFDIDIKDDSEYLPIGVTATISWEIPQGTRSIKMETLIARRHGEPVERAPAEPVDREQRYWEAIEAREAR